MVEDHQNYIYIIMDSVSGYFSLHYHPRDSVVDYKKPGTQRIFVFLNFYKEFHF